MWVPPASVCPAPGSPACASVPSIPLGHHFCLPTLSSAYTGVWLLPPHCPSFALLCVPRLSLPLPGVSVLFCPLLTLQSPTPPLDVPSVPSTVPIPNPENIFSGPSAIPNPSPGCPPAVPAPPLVCLRVCPQWSPWISALLSPFFHLRAVTSLPSIPALSLECPVSTLPCPKSSLWDVHPGTPPAQSLPGMSPLCALLSPMTPPPTPHPGWGGTPVSSLSPSQTHIILEDCGDDNLCVPDLHLAVDT